MSAKHFLGLLLCNLLIVRPFALADCVAMHEAQSEPILAAPPDDRLLLAQRLYSAPLVDPGLIKSCFDVLSATNYEQIHFRKTARPSLQALVAFLESAIEGLRLEQIRAVIEGWGMYGYQCEDTVRRYLQRNGQATVDPLLACLEDDNALIRLHTAMALKSWYAAERRVLDRLRQLLSHPTAKVRIIAAQSLRWIGTVPSSFRKPLQDSLKDGDTEATIVKFMALDKLFPDPGNLALIKGVDLVQAARLLDSDLSRETEEVLYFFESIKASSVPLLVAEIRRVGEGVAYPAWKALSKVGAPAIDSLIAFLHDENKEHRVQAALTLSSMGESAKPAVPQIATLLEDQDDFVRRIGLSALAGLGFIAESALVNILSSTRDAEESNRRSAIEALQAVAPKDERTLRRITEMLNDEVELVRRAAAAALREKGR